MDTYTAITTLRAIRQYRDAPVDDAIITRILEAGRWAGSAKNTQPWHYILVTRRDTLNYLAMCGRYASHLREAAFAIVVVTERAARAELDAGRTIQNMMLAAWAEGVGSCIASMHNEAEAQRILGIPETHKLQQVVGFGYPRRDVVPTIEGRPLQDVLATLGRKPLSELVSHDRWARPYINDEEAPVG
jgi:nitroreductase